MNLSMGNWSVGRLVLILTLLLSIAAPGIAQEKTPKQIFKAYNDSVVTINVTTAKGKASGTGFFVKNSLLVATCLHVVDDATEIVVEGTKGKKWSVGSVYFDRFADAAILKLTVDSGRQPIPLGVYKSVEIGDNVCVIGNPLGFLDQTLSTGIVSAKRVDKRVNIIQTTAPSSEGSSGSPLIDSKGKAIGFIDSSFAEGQNLNIAISTEIMSRLWDTSPLPVKEFLASTAPSRKEKPTSEGKKEPNIAATKALMLALNNVAEEYMHLRCLWNMPQAEDVAINNKLSEGDDKLINLINSSGARLKKLSTELSAVIVKHINDDLIEADKKNTYLDLVTKLSKDSEDWMTHMSRYFNVEKDLDKLSDKIFDLYFEVEYHIYELYSNAMLGLDWLDKTTMYENTTAVVYSDFIIGAFVGDLAVDANGDPILCFFKDAEGEYRYMHKITKIGLSETNMTTIKDGADLAEFLDTKTKKTTKELYVTVSDGKGKSYTNKVEFLPRYDVFDR